MEEGSDMDEPFVAVALRVEDDNHVAVQMLAVEDASHDISSDSVQSTHEQLKTFDSDQLAEILQASDAEETSHQSRSQEEAPSEKTEETSLPRDFAHAVLVAPSIKSEQELEAMAKEAWERYRRDRSEHCTLLQRLNAVLTSVVMKKRHLLGWMIEKQQPRAKSDPAYRRLLMDRQEQILKNTIEAKSIVHSLDGFGIPTGHGESVGTTKRKIFTKVPMPDWLTKNVRPAIGRGRKTDRAVHPLRDMVLQIYGDDRTSSDRGVRWIPKRRTPATSTSSKPDKPSMSPPSSSAARVSPPSVPPLPIRSTISRPMRSSVVSVPIDEGTVSASTKTETTSGTSSPRAPSQSSQDSSVDVPVSEPMGDGAEPIDRRRREDEEQAVRALMGLMHTDRPSTQPPSPSDTTGPSPERHDQPTVASPSDQTSDLFRTTADVTRQSSLIAGGAAFGQSSVPRSSCVAPQLGSLQGTTGPPTPGTFAGIGGGFVAFAKQGNAFTGVSGGTSPFGRGGTPQGLVTSSPLFAQRSKTVNDKLMQMRK